MKKFNKKGIVDLIFLIIGVLIFASGTLIAFKVISSFNDGVAAHADMPAEAITSTQKMTDHFTGVIDHTFLFLVVGIALAAFIMASMIRVHPIFFPFYLIALAFVIFFSAVFSNVYQGMAENAALSAHADQLLFISNILTYLPFIVGVFGGILAIVMYKLYSNSAGGV